MHVYIWYFTYMVSAEHTRACDTSGLRLRACVCDWARTRRHMRARSVGVDRGWLGSQAFESASAVDANIGAWNTARVTTLSYVCAAPGRGLHYGGRARPGFGAARQVVCGGTADARARCAHVQALALRGAMGVGTAARRGGSSHASE